MSEVKLVTPDDSKLQEYLQTIATYDTEFKKWTGRVDKIIKRYRDDDRDKSSSLSRFNILWSNVNTLVPSVFAKIPKPDVSRRFRDQDPVGRVAGLMIERTLSYEIESQSDYRNALKSCVFDRFLGGRGQAWVRYEPSFKTLQPNEPEDGFEITEDADNEAEEVIEWEHTPIDYVHWRDFGHNVARTWEEVTIVWRKVYMGREALVERFGEELGEQIPLDTTPEDLIKSGKNADTAHSQAVIYEMWDKDTGIVCWLSKSMNKILEEKKDPLELTNFWPCPKPLYGTVTTETLVPLPDFTLYQDQANQLDILSDRIDGLIKALKVRGVYDASTPELARLFTEGENNALIPVKNWAAFSEKQGLKGAIDLVDIMPIAQTLAEAYKAMEQIKGQVYEITGISDLQRGDTDANETASAQRLKASYGNLRLKANQEDVARFATELIQIKAEIICKFYRPETIVQASAAEQMQQVDQQVIPQAMALLKDNALRTFRIDIETDSMVQLDEDKLKKDRLEFLGAIGGFIKQAVEAAAQAPQIVPLAMEMLKFGASAFNAGKSLEGIIDQTAEELKQAQQQQAGQPPAPSPEQIKAQADAQASQAKLQSDAQLQQMQHQHEMQIEQIKAQNQAQVEQLKAQSNQSSEQARMQADAQVEQARAQASIAVEKAKQSAQFQVDEAKRQHEIGLAQMGHDHAGSIHGNGVEFDHWKVEYENGIKLAIAELQAKTTLTTSAASASKDGTATEGKPDSGLSSLVDAINSSMTALVEGQNEKHAEIVKALTRPKTATLSSGKTVTIN